MELSLHLSLTDEQYEALMKESYDVIFNNEQTIDALREIVLNEFTNFFGNNGGNYDNRSGVANTANTSLNALVRDCLLKEIPNRSYSSYQRYEANDLLKKIVADATEVQMGALKNKIRMAMSEIISDDKIIAMIMNEVLLCSIRNGITMGTNMMIENEGMKDQQIGMMKNALMSVQDKMNRN